MKKISQKNTGFTLIELLLVIVIISILAVTVFVALDPAKRIKDARDARRATDVNSLLTAIHEYIIDNKGSAPSGLSSTEKQLGTAASGCAISSGGCAVTTAACLDLSTVMAKYLKSIPTDPNDGTDATTKYSAVQDSNGIVTIRACGTEGSTNISSSR